MTQLGMVIDTERCFGCRACMQSCKIENNTPRGAFWMHVFRYEEGEFPDVDQGFMPRPCQHCSEAACTDVCPTGARFKREKDGIVLTDYERCIGCRYCEVACPYGVNYAQFVDPQEAQYGFANENAGADWYGSGNLTTEVDTGPTPWTRPEHDEPISPRGTKAAGNPPQGVMGKCTFCVHRQEDEETKGTVACAETCTADAIMFGNLDDPESEPRQYLRQRQGAPRFKLMEDEGTKPNIIYVGTEPSEDARPIEDADTFKDPEKAMEVEKNPPDALETEVNQ